MARSKTILWTALCQTLHKLNLILISLCKCNADLLPGILKWSHPWAISTKIFNAFLTSCMHATCPPHNFLLCMITVITYGEKCTPQSFSLCSFLHPPVAFFHSNVQTFPLAPCFQATSVQPVLVSFAALSWEAESFTRTENTRHTVLNTLTLVEVHFQYI